MNTENFGGGGQEAKGGQMPPAPPTPKWNPVDDGQSVELAALEWTRCIVPTTYNQQ